MSDEENQLHNSSQQTDEVSPISSDHRAGTSTVDESDRKQTGDALGEVTIDIDTDRVGTNDQAETTEASLTAEVAMSNLVESLKQETEELKAQLEASNNQCESFKSQAMRLAADFDNFRKRTAKEKEDLELQIKSSTLSKLLPVVDDFERARSLIKPQNDAEMTIHKSYQSVYKQMVECLKRLGVSPMRPEGREFDPNLHEAVMREPTNEHPEGTVIEELVRGYFLGDRVLRHAMVKVAAPSEEAIASENSPDLTEN